MLHFNILGTLQLETRTGAVNLTSPRMKSVLAMLLLHGSRPVTTESMINEVWPGRPPRSSVATMQTYIYQIRKVLAEIGGRDAEKILVTDGSGYHLDIGPDHLDYTRFIEKYDQGRTLLLAHRDQEAAEVLADALALWRGRPLADVHLGSTLAAEVIRMEEQRDGALRHRIEADLRNGRHVELIPELQFLVRTEPLHEWLHAQLLSALTRAGRRADALRAYQDVRRILRDELGLGPSKELEQLHMQVLTGQAV